MDEFLQKLINKDTARSKFTSDDQLIQQGLAPLYAISSSAINLQKANLLETAKFNNWKKKAQILFNQLNIEKIEFLVFKGFAYTFLLYNDTHLRPYSDIDIIINQSDYHKVHTILSEQGYLQFPSRQGQFVSFQNSYFDKGSPQTIIDLHWQINNRIEFHQHFPFVDLYNHSQQLTTDTISFKTIGPIYGFILGCFHYQAHRPSDRKHIWLYDLALMWHAMTTNERDTCLAKAVTTQQSNIVLSTLNLLNTTFVHCLQINNSESKEPFEATELYLHKRQKKITDIKTRLSNIKGLKNKIIFLSEYIFQSKSYVRNRFNIKSKVWVYFYYPRMWIEDILKLFK